MRPNSSIDPRRLCFLLGLLACLLTGCAATKDALDSANRRLSAEAGEAQTQYELGIAYLQGDGVEKNSETALYWLERAAKNGHPQALYLVARTTLDDPKSGSAKRKEAWRQMEQAANLGQEEAISEMAAAYAKGGALPTDIAWAARWYGKAAQLGDSDAQFIIATRYVTGEGLPKDLGRAYGWLLASAKSGQDAARKAAAQLKPALSVEQRAEGEAFANRFRPSTPDLWKDQATVIWMQQELASRGYRPGAADGYLGPRTTEAVSAYRSDHGLGGSLVDQELVMALRS